uniref:Uncharacterized protein n=1 Tax=Romanomermis culicivorax TaxID=13658 RepID=A0A915KXT1_ROMCU
MKSFNDKNGEGKSGKTPSMINTNLGEIFNVQTTYLDTRMITVDQYSSMLAGWTHLDAWYFPGTAIHVTPMQTPLKR